MLILIALFSGSIQKNLIDRQNQICEDGGGDLLAYFENDSRAEAVSRQVAHFNGLTGFINQPQLCDAERAVSVGFRITVVDG